MNDHHIYSSKVGRRFRAARWKLNQYLHRRQRLERARRRYADRDTDENRRTALPEGERISWPCMWMCEVFAPSHAKAMVRGIEGMEEANPQAFMRSNDLAAWLEKARSTGGGYLSVGSFSNRSRFPSSRPIDLPDGFASAHVDLHQLAPGITLLIFRFDLDDQNVECLTRVLRQSFGSSVSPIKGRPGAHSIRTPEATKAEAIRSQRETLRTSAASWIASRTPGVFSNLDGVDYPAWDLLLTETDSLSEPTNQKEMWRYALGLGPAAEIWRSDDLDGLSLMNSVFDDLSGSAPSFVGQERRAVKLAGARHTAEEPVGLGYVISDDAADLLCVWSLLLALEAYGARFASIRDQLSEPAKWPGSARGLRALREEVMPLAFDLTTLGEASQDVEALDRLKGGVDFEYMGRSADKDEPPSPVKLTEVITERINRRGSEIAGQGRDITNALRTQGELLLATTNIRLQWMVLFLTLALGAASLYFAATH
ncbi:MAG TPA: hypothetical protein VHU86_05810 [Solirubrobacterales bacterium]|nr:hypothetical protein [Solirubrobacterales bacterium]